jgi:RNA-directed DNA polymerase
MVVKLVIEPDLDAVFLADSYGYRPGKSALDAVGVTRQRCWEYDWVLEFDIKGLWGDGEQAVLGDADDVTSEVFRCRDRRCGRW